MTRDNTSYREKGRAVFLAAIMVLSVVAMSAAFAGSAAAEDPLTKISGDDFQDGQTGFDALSNEIRFVGQEYNLAFDSGDSYDDDRFTEDRDTFYLAEVTETDDSSNPSSFGSVTPIQNTTESGDKGVNATVDLSGVDSGTYVISNRSSVTASAGFSEQFSVREQEFTVTFDDDSVDEFSNGSAILLNDGISSNRPFSDSTTATNDGPPRLSVQVTGPDGDTLSNESVGELLQVRAGANTNPGDGTAGQLEGEVVQSGDNGGDAIGLTAANFLSEYDINDDSLTDMRDDGWVTFNLTAGADFDGETPFENDDPIVNGDQEINLNATNLANGQGLPDEGEYTFEFVNTDSGVSVSDTIFIGESDEDAEITDVTNRNQAGDIVEFSVDLSDSIDNSAYVQFGSESSEFVDVMYVEADDASEPVDVTVNTRLLGTNVGTDQVYDRENAAAFESEIHGTITNTPEAPLNLYGDDGDNLKNTFGASNDDNDYLSNLGLTDRSATDQLTRPPQPTQYQLIVAGTSGLDGDQEAVFDADDGGAANNQLDASTITLESPDLGEITTYTAPADDADDTADPEELLSDATESDEVAVGDRLIVEVPASGIYGSLVANASDGTDGGGGSNFDRLSDGASSQILDSVTGDLVDTSGGASNNESINFDIEAETSTGNTDPKKIRLGTGSSDSEVYVVLDEANDRFFVVADTSSDNAFENGDAPEATQGFTANLEYDADNGDDRFEFRSSGDPFNPTSASVNYPYFQQGETLTTSEGAFDLGQRSITFDNLNEAGDVQIQQNEEAVISGTTNVAPGSDAEIVVSGTGFQVGQNVNISSDGSLSATFDLSDREIGENVELQFRVSGGQEDSANGVIVESVGDTDGGEETNETDTDDGEEMNETDEPADDGETDETTDDGESTDDGTPGFGAVVALIALIGAALLAVRRQN